MKTSLRPKPFRLGGYQLAVALIVLVFCALVIGIAAIPTYYG